MERARYAHTGRRRGSATAEEAPAATGGDRNCARRVSGYWPTAPAAASVSKQARHTRQWCSSNLCQQHAWCKNPALRQHRRSGAASCCRTTAGRRRDSTRKCARAGRARWRTRARAAPCVRPSTRQAGTRRSRRAPPARATARRTRRPRGRSGGWERRGRKRALRASVRRGPRNFFTSRRTRRQRDPRTAREAPRTTRGEARRRRAGRRPRR